MKRVFFLILLLSLVTGISDEVYFEESLNSSGLLYDFNVTTNLTWVANSTNVIQICAWDLNNDSVQLTDINVTILNMSEYNLSENKFVNGCYLINVNISECVNNTLGEVVVKQNVISRNKNFTIMCKGIDDTLPKTEYALTRTLEELKDMYNSIEKNFTEYVLVFILALLIIIAVIIFIVDYFKNRPT